MTDAKKNPGAGTPGLEDSSTMQGEDLMTKNTRIDEETRAHYAQLLADFLELDNETRAAHPLTSDWIGHVPDWADETALDISASTADACLSFIARDQETDVTITRYIEFSILTGSINLYTETTWWPQFSTTDDPTVDEVAQAAAAFQNLRARIRADEER